MLSHSLTIQLNEEPVYSTLALTSLVGNCTAADEMTGFHHYVVLMLRWSKQALLKQITSKLSMERIVQAPAKWYLQFARLIDF
jgi:hypothetical protein